MSRSPTDAFGEPVSSPLPNCLWRTIYILAPPQKATTAPRSTANLPVWQQMHGSTAARDIVFDGAAPARHTLFSSSAAMMYKGAGWRSFLKPDPDI